MVILVASLNVVSCQSPGGGKPEGINERKPIKLTLTPDEFEKKLSSKQGVQLIDVRTPQEYAGGHLRNALNINIRSDDFDDGLNKLDKTKPIMVYCLSGGRSSLAAKKMQEMGFNEVYDLDGGIMKWRNAGKPVESGTSADKQGLTLAELSKIIMQNKYVLVDYNATWCEPCKKLMPMLEDISSKRKDSLSLIKVDADDNKALLDQ